MWNYRVMRKAIGGRFIFGVHEFYYSNDSGADGDVDRWTDAPPAAIGETVDELRTDIERQLAALKQPVLDFTTGRPSSMEKEMSDTITPEEHEAINQFPPEQITICPLGACTTKESRRLARLELRSKFGLKPYPRPPKKHTGGRRVDPARDELIRQMVLLYKSDAEIIKAIGIKKSSLALAVRRLGLVGYRKANKQKRNK